MTVPGDGGARSEFRVLLLGPFAVYRDGEALDPSAWQRTVLTLFKLLLTARGGRRLRDEVVEVLWPEAAPETGASNLRYVLSLLRKHLGGGDPPPVLSERGWISLNPAYPWDIDLARFEALAGQGDRGALEGAMWLYRGEPLEEHRYEDWAIPVRERLRREWGDTGLRLADLTQQAGEAETAIAWLEKLLDQDPLDEETLRRLLPLLDAVGRRAEALRRYGQFEDRLRRELDAPPSPEMVAAAAALREATSTRSIAPSAANPPAEGARRPTLPVGAYLGALPAAPLVGRAAELGAAVVEVEVAGRGEGRLVLITGEPGVGKTRLAQEVMGQLAERAFTVAAGRCYEIEQSTPYYPFLDALGALFAGLPASLRDEVPHRWPYLGRLLPELIPTPVMERAREDEQQYLHRAVTGLLIAASQHAPVALMLDDLHWADAASLRLLLHLSRHTRESRVFLLGTSRDVEAGRPGTQPAEPGRHAEGAHQVAPLERALHDLAREDLVRRIAVRRLDRGGTAALVAATLGAAEVPGTIAELVYRHTEGNPFFIKQVVQSLRERGDLRRVNGRWERRESGEIQAPETVRAAVGLRLARLSDTTQEILREASVLGQTFLFDDLQAVGARDEGALEDALEEAGSHGLVQALTADRYGFDHALTRQTVVAELAPRRRRRLHLAAAEAIVSGAARERDRERRAAEIARHFLEADAREEALRWSLRAGDAAGATFAHDEAERHYRTALALAVELEDRAGEAEALVRLGETLITISRQAEALSLEERAAALYRSLGDVMGEGRAAARVAWAHSGLGTFEASLEGLRAAIARLQPLGTSPVLAELHATFIYQLMATGRLEEALAGEDRMELLARERGYERYLPAARLQRGFILWRMGRAGEGRAIVEGTLAQLEEVGDLFALSSGVQALASHDRDRGELRRARQHLDRALAINTRRNDPTAIANVLAFTALLEILEGKWADARAHCEEAMSLVEDRTDQPDTAIPMGVLGMLRVRRGDHRDIEAYLARSIAMASAMQSATIVSHMALADYQLQRGRPAAARAGLETMIQHARPRMGPLTWVYPGLARACLLMGDLAAASAALATGAEGAEREGNRVVMVELRELEGELLLRRGRLSEAEAMLALALAEAREIGLPPREARTLMAWATLRARQGKRDEARLSLESALAILERLGARPDVEEARHLLDSLRAGMNVW